MQRKMIACSSRAFSQSAPGPDSARPTKPNVIQFERPGAALAVDWSKGAMQAVTLDDNRLLAFVNGQPGRVYILALTQDATGSCSVTWTASVRWPGGTGTPILTMTANKTDYISSIYNGARNTYDGVTFAQNY